MSPPDNEDERPGRRSALAASSDAVTPAVRSAEREAVPAGAGFRSSSGSLRAVEPGTLVAARYQVMEFLARGGMGEVYEALDMELMQPVALKMLRPELAGDPAALQRLKREIQLARRVTHPNVSRIFDLGRHRVSDGSEVTFLTMELLRGETLSDRIRRSGRLRPEEALPLASQMAEGLAAAHGAGIVHRDFKSSNVMLVPSRGADRVVVTDFGLARSHGPDEWGSFSMTAQDMVVGTAAYMAPEQAEGREATPLSDLYAFGVVLFEMVTGSLPHPGSSPLSILVARLKAPARSPRVVVPDLPASFEHAILRCLELRPERRPSTPAEAIRLLTEPPPGERDTAEIPLEGGALEARSEVGVKTLLLIAPAEAPAQPDRSTEGGSTARHDALVLSLATRHGGHEVDRLDGLLLLFSRPLPAILFALDYLREAESLGRPSRAAVHLGEVTVHHGSENDVARGARPLVVEGAARTTVARTLWMARRKQLFLTRAAFDLAKGASKESGSLPASVECVVHGRFAVPGTDEEIELAEIGIPEFSPLSPPDPVRARALDAGSAVTLARAAPMERRRRQAAALLIVLLVASGLSILSIRVLRPRAAEREATRSSLNVRKAVAILGFRNLTGKPESAWISTALSEMLGGELAAGERVRTVGGENVARMKIDLSLVEAESLAPDTLARIRQNLGTDLVVLGSYLVQSSGRLSLVLNVQDAATGQTLHTVKEEGSEATLIDLVSIVGGRLRGSLGITGVGEREAVAARALLPANPEAMRLYAEGLSRLRLLDVSTARRYLEKAVTTDPSFPLAQAALAEALDELGLVERAKEAARKAFELSKGLSREESLFVEGRYLEKSQSWEKATETYGALFGFFPDNVDYGLRLAGAQMAGGRATDALRTVERLRQLPRPASDDPRLDIWEARAAESISDYERERQAALRAAEKARRIGARLLLARAQLSLGNALVRLGRLQDGRDTCEEARAAFAVAGDRSGEARALNRIANVAFEQGDLPGARRTFEQVLFLYREGENPNGQAIALNNLADTAKEMGDLADARQTFLRSLELRRETSDAIGEGLCLSNLADVLLLEGNLLEARRRYDEALALNRRTNFRYALITNLLGLGEWHLRRGEPRQARTFLDEAIRTCEDTGERRMAGTALVLLAEVHREEGDAAQARRLLEEALSARTQLGLRRELADTLLAMARLDLDARRAEDAVVRARDALSRYEGLTVPDRSAVARATLAEALAAAGKTGEAEAELRSLAPLVTRTQNPAVRFAATLARARVLRPPEERALAEGAKDAERLRFEPYRLELRIERQERQALRSTAELATLQKEATSRGLLRLASRASALAPGGALTRR